MSDERGRPGHGAATESHGDPGGFDKELRVRGIVLTAAGILALTAVSMIVVWWQVGGLKRELVESDPTIPAVIEQERARVREEAAAQPAPPSAFKALRLPAGTLLPPGPQLQPSPEVDMAAQLAAEEHELSTYGWIDRERGIVRVPIERAMDDLVAEGLPRFAPPSAAGGAQVNRDSPLAPIPPPLP